MKKIAYISFILCVCLVLSACSSFQNLFGTNPRSGLTEHEFHGVTFYLPAEFSQSNIFADSNKGRIQFTNSAGIEVMVSVNEASYIAQYFDAEVVDAQGYAQIYADSYKAESIPATLSSKQNTPYITLRANNEGITQYGVLGFYYSNGYCACISAYTDSESIFNQNEGAMIDYVTLAAFQRWPIRDR